MIGRYMKQFTELKKAKTETSNFYGLPKIHDLKIKNLKIKGNIGK